MRLEDAERKIRLDPYVDVPIHQEVRELLKQQDLSDTYHPRGAGLATSELDEAEQTHREWVKDIVDLSDFKYCYFVNGATDAIHHWRMTDNREWQKLCYGEYNYPDSLGTDGTVTCDVPGQYMDADTHRSGIPGKIDSDKPLYISIPSAADGNIFDPGKIDAPVILDCTYVGTTSIQKIKVPRNTEQTFFSFTKPFGLVGQRLGLVYTKEPHKSLHPLKQFENWNYSGVRTIQMLMEKFAVDEMWNRFKDKQNSICRKYNFKPSDVFFLATTKDLYYKRRRRMKWNDDARICITPLMEFV